MYKVAVVGCGMMSDAWIEITKRRNDAEIIALVDIDIEQAMQQKEKHKLDAPTYTSLDEAMMIEEIDIVYDITPPEFHSETVIFALNNGCHVFGEKPMSDSLESAIAMVECAERTGNDYFVMQNRRYLPMIYALKEFIQNQSLGKLGQISANFQLNPHFGGFREDMLDPLLADMAIHTFDAARFISGQNPVSIYCHSFNPSWSWYDGHANAVCIVEMEDGTIFDYRGSWCANGLNTSWEAEWRCGCENGSVYWDGFNQLYYESVKKDTFKTGIDPDESHDIRLQNIEPVSMPFEGHEACINEMYESLKAGQRPQTDCRDNLHSIKMVQEAIRSSREGKLVKL